MFIYIYIYVDVDIDVYSLINTVIKKWFMTGSFFRIHGKNC